MPASFIVEDGTATISFTWPGIVIAKVQEIIGGAALYLYDAGQFVPTVEVDGEQVPKPWADLTNQEKLTMVFRYTQYTITEQAKAAKVNTDVGTARDAAIEYAEMEYILD